MTDSRHLHIEAVRLRRRMQAKLNDADKANQRSEALTRLGDFNRSTIESDRSRKYYKEALELERAAIECDNKAAALEAKACEIEKQENELQSSIKLKIDILEKLKRALRGN